MPAQTRFLVFTSLHFIGEGICTILGLCDIKVVSLPGRHMRLRAVMKEVDESEHRYSYPKTAS